MSLTSWPRLSRNGTRCCFSTNPAWSPPIVILTASTSCDALSRRWKREVDEAADQIVELASGLLVLADRLHERIGDVVFFGIAEQLDQQAVVADSLQPVGEGLVATAGARRFPTPDQLLEREATT